MLHIVTAAPSVATRTFPGDCITVNRAAIIHPCTHIVAGDTKTLEKIRWKPGVTLWTMKNETPTPLGWPLLGRFDLLPGWRDLPANHANWSIQGAIAVAVHLGYRWMVIHGTEAYFDKVERTADASGYDGPDADRTAERWKRERADLDLSIAWAQAKGATVYLDRT